MPILSAVINNQSPISKNGESFDCQQPFVPLITEEIISLNGGTDQATHEYVTGLLLVHACICSLYICYKVTVITVNCNGGA